MANITWSLEAVEDLNAIADSCETYSEAYASSVITSIYDSVDRLKNFPRSGRMVPEFEFPQLREVVLPKYRIIYFVSDEGNVEVITIRLTSKPLPPSVKPST